MQASAAHKAVCVPLASRQVSPGLSRPKWVGGANGVRVRLLPACNINAATFVVAQTRPEDLTASE